jgi:hypothetical protein
MKRKVVKNKSEDTIVECSKSSAMHTYLYKDSQGNISRLYYIGRCYVWINITGLGTVTIQTAGYGFGRIELALSHILDAISKSSEGVIYEFDDEKDLREYLKSEL